MTLKQRDKVELVVGTLIVLIYVGSVVTGYLHTDDRLLQVLVLAGAAAIFGDNLWEAVNPRE